MGDMVVTAAPGSTIPVPSGSAAFDQAGNQLNEITVPPSGYVVFESKAGAPGLTPNQTAVYPNVPNGVVTTSGANAVRLPTALPAGTPVILLQKVP